MTKDSSRQSRQKELGTSFHRTFALVRPAVAEVLQVMNAEGNQKSSLTNLLKERTALGPVYIQAMPRYAFGSGLLTMSHKSMNFTAFGEQACRHDPNLSNPATQWLMHYYLSSSQGPGPAFWHRLVTRHLRVGDELQRGQVADVISRVAEEAGKELPDRTAQSTATVFLGTYSKSDALGPLGILSSVDNNKRVTYLIREPVPIPLWSLAYALADYWEFVWGQQSTINLAELTEAGGFASTFTMGSRQLEWSLEQLSDLGVLELYRTAPPYQVVRLWRDKNDLLEHMYE